ncbi:MAG TPA: hypothetical protein VEC16_00875 [Alphaproteobacteria bacterium]|nr:hypothetical protein [Alphaproteobacteria bacterium]
MNNYIKRIVQGTAALGVAAALVFGYRSCNNEQQIMNLDIEQIQKYEAPKTDSIHQFERKDTVEAIKPTKIEKRNNNKPKKIDTLERILKNQPKPELTIAEKNQTDSLYVLPAINANNSTASISEVQLTPAALVKSDSIYTGNLKSDSSDFKILEAQSQLIDLPKQDTIAKITQLDTRPHALETIAALAHAYDNNWQAVDNEDIDNDMDRDLVALKNDTLYVMRNLEHEGWNYKTNKIVDVLGLKDEFPISTIKKGNRNHKYNIVISDHDEDRKMDFVLINETKKKVRYFHNTMEYGIDSTLASGNQLFKENTEASKEKTKEYRKHLKETKVKIIEYSSIEQNLDKDQDPEIVTVEKRDQKRARPQLVYTDYTNGDDIKTVIDKLNKNHEYELVNSVNKKRIILKDLTDKTFTIYQPIMKKGELTFRINKKESETMNKSYQSLSKPKSN